MFPVAGGVPGAGPHQVGLVFLDAHLINSRNGRPETHEVINLMTESMAQLYRAVPIHFEGNRLTVATCDPQNITIQDELRSLLGYEVKVVIAGETDIKKTLERYYGELAKLCAGSDITKSHSVEEARSRHAVKHSAAHR